MRRLFTGCPGLSLHLSLGPAPEVGQSTLRTSLRSGFLVVKKQKTSSFHVSSLELQANMIDILTLVS
jgi:hypothetical protein